MCDCQVLYIYIIYVQCVEVERCSPGVRLLITLSGLDIYIIQKGDWFFVL